MAITRLDALQPCRVGGRALVLWILIVPRDKSGSSSVINLEMRGYIDLYLCLYFSLFLSS